MPCVIVPREAQACVFRLEGHGYVHAQCWGDQYFRIDPATGEAVCGIDSSFARRWTRADLEKPTSTAYYPARMRPGYVADFPSTIRHMALRALRLGNGSVAYVCRAVDSNGDRCYASTRSLKPFVCEPLATGDLPWAEDPPVD